MLTFLKWFLIITVLIPLGTFDVAAIYYIIYVTIKEVIQKSNVDFS